MNFIEQLKQIPDHRKSKGKRHPLWLVMCLTLLGVLCNYHGYRPLADFCEKHWQTLQTMLELPSDSRIPSYSTFRRVIQGVEIEPVVKLFNEWCRNSHTGESGQWLAMDGKSIKCTVTNQTDSKQNFTSTVSAFTHETGEVIALAVSENKQISEIEVVKQVITSLQGQKASFTMDALHCQKDTVKLIAEQEQHYLIALKNNQPNLVKTLDNLHQTTAALSYAEEFDKSHGRQVRRRVWVYPAPTHLRKHWSSLQSLIYVEREGWRDDKPFFESLGYISDLSLNAAQFLDPIRLHWGIENRLHWVRDVLFQEDTGLRRGGNAPTIWAIIHCFIMTTVRRLGYRTIPQGQRVLANQVHQVFDILSCSYSY
jgi:predicted transposase YbfD/YdcC